MVSRVSRVSKWVEIASAGRRMVTFPVKGTGDANGAKVTATKRNV